MEAEGRPNGGLGAEPPGKQKLVFSSREGPTQIILGVVWLASHLVVLQQGLVKAFVAN